MADTKISRKDFLKLGGAGLSAIALHSALSTAGGRPARASDSGQPNILFICMDQLHAFQYLPKQLPLPAHERLLRESLDFTRYHVHQAPCGPSRSVFYTGQHVQKTGMYTNPPGENADVEPEAQTALELPTSIPTIGTMLREQGYYTAYKGKWHLSMINQRANTGRGYPNASHILEPYGFSDYNFDGEHTGLTWVGFGHDGFIAADSANLMYDFAYNDRTKGKPWFLAVNLVNPHDIMFYDPTGEQNAKRGDATGIGPMLTEPRIPFYELDWKEPLPKSFYEDDLSTKPAIHQPGPPGTPFGGIPRSDEAAWRRYQNYYFNCVRDVDRHIATVLDALDRFGLADNTIVVLTADHGEQNGAHGMRGKGPDIYRETHNVPLIIRHPDHKGARTTNALAGGVDLAPTLLGFAGMSAEALADQYPDLHGVDLAPVLNDARTRTARDERGILFDFVTPGVLGDSGPPAEEKRRALIRGIHDGRYKFARYFAVSEHHMPRDWETLIAHNDLELYDTQADPEEIINLAHEPEAYKALILSLNAKVNALIEQEVGADDGAIYPGPTPLYNTL